MTDIDYLDEDSIFNEYVEQDSDVCKSCYRKLRDFHDPPEFLPSSALPQVEYREDARFGYFDDEINTGRPSRKKAYCTCGAADWNDIKIRPMDSEKMNEASERIIQTLREKFFEVDEDVFFSVVEEKQDKPEYQFREEKVFEEATEQAVEERKLEEDE